MVSQVKVPESETAKVVLGFKPRSNIGLTEHQIKKVSDAREKAY